MKKMIVCCYILVSFLFTTGTDAGLMAGQEVRPEGIVGSAKAGHRFAKQAKKDLRQNANRSKTRKKKHCKIRGRITEARSNEPLPGTNVVIVGTQYGAATDLNGYYEISAVPPGKYILRASMMGYTPVEKEIVVRHPEKVIVQDFSLREGVLEADAIVVTATGTPHFYKDTPVKTTVISRRLIETRNAENLAEALALQTGVRVEMNCQNCNFTQVRLLGLEGHYSQILIEGDPVVSSLAGVYGLEQIPEEMIERVEIVKGGGSSLYGGSAVAGVINLITRRPSGNKTSLTIRNADIRGTLDSQIGVTVSRVNKAGNSGAYFFGSLQRRSPMDYNGDGFSEIGKLENQSVGLSWYHHPRRNNELFVHLHHIQENRRGGNKFDLPPHKADIAEAVQSWRWGGTVRWKHNPTPLLDYKTYFSFAYQRRSSYYGACQDPNAYGKTRNPLYVMGFQVNYKLAGHLFSTGLQYQREKLDDIAVAYNRIISDVYTDVGVFFQDNIHIGRQENAEMIVGVRYDKNSKLSRNIFSPRLGMRIKLSDAMIFRGGFSTGFKAPQIFDEDLHITQVGGEGQIIRNADDLTEERSITYTGGLEYQEVVGDMALRLGVNLFLTRLADTFLLNKQDDPTTDEVEFYRINGKGATVKGVEVDLGVRLLANTELRAGVTMQKSQWDEPDPDFHSRTFFRTPPLYGHVRLSSDLTKSLSVFVSASYTGRMWVPHYAGYIPADRLEHSCPFLEIDLNCSYRFKAPLTGSNTTLTLAVQNITNSYQSDFDRGVQRDAGYVYGPPHPRRFLLGLISEI